MGFLAQESGIAKTERWASLCPSAASVGALAPESRCDAVAGYPGGGATTSLLSMLARRQKKQLQREVEGNGKGFV